MKKIVIVPDSDPRPGIALDEDELGNLVTGFRKSAPSLAPIVAVAAATGVRRNEVLALRWTDFDAEKKTLRVERAWEPSKAHGLRLKAPKTERGRRTIDLDAGTVAMLVKHREVYLRIVAGVMDGTDINLTLIKLPQDALIFPANPARGQDSISSRRATLATRPRTSAALRPNSGSRTSGSIICGIPTRRSSSIAVSAFTGSRPGSAKMRQPC
jgi:integrase